MVVKFSQACLELLVYLLGVNRSSDSAVAAVVLALEALVDRVRGRGPRGHAR